MAAHDNLSYQRHLDKDAKPLPQNGQSPAPDPEAVQAMLNHSVKVATAWAHKAGLVVEEARNPYADALYTLALQEQQAARCSWQETLQRAIEANPSLADRA
jgi:hypothetical protein